MASLISHPGVKRCTTYRRAFKRYRVTLKPLWHFAALDGLDRFDSPDNPRAINVAWFATLSEFYKAKPQQFHSPTHHTPGFYED